MARGLCSGCYQKRWHRDHPGKLTVYSRRKRAKQKGIELLLDSVTLPPVLVELRRATEADIAALRAEQQEIEAWIERLQEALAAVEQLEAISQQALHQKERRKERQWLSEARTTLQSIRALLRHAA